MDYIQENIVEYNAKRPNKKQIAQALNLRDKFVKDYPLSVLQAWTIKNIDDYIIGKQKQTFCCRLEHELVACGNILGATAAKFGVYFSKKYIFTKKYGISVDDAFNKVKDEIVKLINAGAIDDVSTIRDSLLCPTMRGKILFLYYPDKYLPIYDYKHLDFFINIIGLKIGSKDILDKQHVLIDWKDRDSIMKNWSLLEFQNFLYFTFGKPQKTIWEERKDIAWEKQVYNQLKDKKKNEILSIIDKPKNKPKEITNRLGSYYVRNPLVARNALIDAKHCCEYNPIHLTFKRKNCDENYTEPHHLIPMCFQKNFNTSLDVEANIVSLCSTCHNQIHYGKGAEEIIKALFLKRKDRLKKAGIEIEEIQLLAMYGIY